MFIINMIALFAGIAVLIILSYKGINIYISSLVATLVVVVFTRDINLFDGLAEYCSGTASFVSGYLIYMFLAVALGDVMNTTGTATVLGRAIVKATGGKGAIATAILVGAAITTTGISGYVAAFASFPIVLQVFKAARLPRELLPGILASSQILGQGILPFNTLTNNTIPTEFLNSSIAGAPLLRMLGFFFCFAGCWIYFEYATRKIRRQKDEAEIIREFDLYNDEVVEENLPTFARSFLPVLVGIAFLVGMTLYSSWKTMNVVYVTLTLSMALCILMNWDRIKDKWISVEQKAFVTSIGSLMTCGIVIGFGRVIAMSPFFLDVVGWLNKIDLNPYMQTAIITNVIAMIMASAPGGIRMTLEVFGERWMAMGVNVNALHAITTTAGLGLNTMPHNGSVIVCNQRSRLPIKGTFRHTFITGGLIIALGSIFQAVVAIALY